LKLPPPTFGSAHKKNSAAKTGQNSSAKFGGFYLLQEMDANRELKRVLHLGEWKDVVGNVGVGGRGVELGEQEPPKLPPRRFFLAYARKFAPDCVRAPISPESGRRAAHRTAPIRF
jgi:hypothetical protein